MFNGSEKMRYLWKILWLSLSFSFKREYPLYTLIELNRFILGTNFFLLSLLIWMVLWIFSFRKNLQQTENFQVESKTNFVYKIWTRNDDNKQAWMLWRFRIQKHFSYGNEVHDDKKSVSFYQNLTGKSKGINNKAAWSSYVCVCASAE